MKLDNRKSLAESGFTLVGNRASCWSSSGSSWAASSKGQEMITQAKIKNLINDFNGVTVAVTSYQDRYRALPGDDPNADARAGPRTPTAAPGDGNGIIGNLQRDRCPAPTESRLFWQHLRIAGFVPGP